MKVLIFFLFLTNFSFGGAIEEGNAAFAKENWKIALEKYREALASDSGNALLHYNIGTTQLRQGSFSQATESFSRALQSDDSLLVRNAYYNMAGTAYRIGEQEQDPKEKISAWRKAIAAYKKSLDYAENYEKAKRNIEFVQVKLKEEIDKQKPEEGEGETPKPSPEAKEALAKALQLAKQELYHDAKAVLEKIMANDPTAAPFSAYVQRIQDVIDIGEGRKPTTPLDNSNRQAEEAQI